MVRTASSNDVYYIRFTFTFYRIHHHSQHVAPSRTVNTVIVSRRSSSFPTVVRSHGVGFSGEKELGGKFGRSRFLEVGRRWNQNEEGTRKEQQRGRGEREDRGKTEKDRWVWESGGCDIPPGRYSGCYHRVKGCARDKRAEREKERRMERRGQRQAGGEGSIGIIWWEGKQLLGWWMAPGRRCSASL